ncbi:hypothetical protein AAC387_Pa01g1256 [Persea americana]
MPCITLGHHLMFPSLSGRQSPSSPPPSPCTPLYSSRPLHQQQQQAAPLLLLPAWPIRLLFSFPAATTASSAQRPARD